MISTIGQFVINIDHQGHCFVEGYPTSGFTSAAPEKRMNFNALLNITAKGLEDRLNENRDDLGVDECIERLIDTTMKTLTRKETT